MYRILGSGIHRRHKEENVSITLDPPLQGFTREDGLNGSIYVMERCCSPIPLKPTSLKVLFSALVFLSSSGRGFQVDYPSITLHAISRAESGPSIYCQLDEPPLSDGPTDEDEDASNMRELVVIPKDPSSCAFVFRDSVIST